VLHDTNDSTFFTCDLRLRNRPSKNTLRDEIRRPI
jgi:hypothetical protein